MARVDLTGKFKTRQEGQNVETTSSLVELLNIAAGVTIVRSGTDLNRNLEQTAVTVASAFHPVPCNPSESSATIPDGQPVSEKGSASEGSSTPGEPGDEVAFHETSGSGPAESALIGVPPATAELFTRLRQKLLVVDSALGEMVSTLNAGIGAQPALVRASAPRPPACFRYRSTEHGPLGLFRSREILRAFTAPFCG